MRILQYFVGDLPVFQKLNTRCIALYSKLEDIHGNNLSKLTKYCRRVLIFPLGNNTPHLSLYLDVADAKDLEPSWSRYARFQLAVLNQVDLRKTIAQGNDN